MHISRFLLGEDSNSEWLTEEKVSLLVIVRHETPLLRRPSDRHLVSKQEQVGHGDVRVLLDDVGLSVVLEVTVVPPVGRSGLQSGNRVILAKEGSFFDFWEQDTCTFQPCMDTHLHTLSLLEEIYEISLEWCCLLFSFLQYWLICWQNLHTFTQLLNSMTLFYTKTKYNGKICEKRLKPYQTLSIYFINLFEVRWAQKISINQDLNKRFKFPLLI